MDNEKCMILIPTPLQQNLELGIDNLFFTSNSHQTTSPATVKGLKNVPCGLHLIHITNTLINTRAGVFIDCEPGYIYILECNGEGELCLTGVISSTQRVIIWHLSEEELHSNHLATVLILDDISRSGGGMVLTQSLPYMVDYTKQSQSLEKQYWSKLVDSIVDVQTYIPNGTVLIRDKFVCSGLISTSQSSLLEVEQLNDVLLKSAKARTNGSHENDKFYSMLNHDELMKEYLKLTRITYKKIIPQGEMTPQERSQKYLDKTWFILQQYPEISADVPNDVGLRKLLSEFKFCFIIALIMNNWCCLEQYYAMIKLIFNSMSFISRFPKFTVRFIRVLKEQLEIVFGNMATSQTAKIVELTDDDADNGDDDGDQFIKVSKVIKIIKEFIKDIDSVTDYTVLFELNSLIAFINDKFDIKLGYSLEDEGEDDDEGFFYDRNEKDFSDYDDEDDYNNTV
ncbi:hypothetical protein CANARDRAFT_27486 [[Candida] arabinofermentans NRRL YB-2248]|uniref:Uncharacterized protein n=1 Tax=[Candida] arabinofermentans NRRL YB-2248 TaxID=983967 RepID=A0A1E4T3A5_9ASCO|nr:hypothetical protein CANARDRAFT_27486 [[Candida] arabinofermentans NRRL YB-2248]